MKIFAGQPKSLRTVLLALLILAPLHGAVSRAESEDGLSPEQSGEMYLPVDDAIGDVEETLRKARDGQRLALIVMGANWCHDSTALAARIHEAPLSRLIRDDYVVKFVDVGYLDKGRDVIKMLGLPVHYATPTVLIVDPVSGGLVNAGNRHQWGHAADISMRDSVTYFRNMSNTDLSRLREPTESSATLDRLSAEIDAFEDRHADRLYAAYAVLSPGLRTLYEGGDEVFSDADWDAVRDYRMQLALDIDALREEALRRVTAGERDIRLEYPQYPAFEWEEMPDRNRDGDGQ